MIFIPTLQYHLAGGPGNIF